MAPAFEVEGSLCWGIRLCPSADGSVGSHAHASKSIASRGVGSTNSVAKAPPKRCDGTVRQCLCKVCDATAMSLPPSVLLLGRFSVQRRWHGGSLSPRTPTRQQTRGIAP